MKKGSKRVAAVMLATVVCISMLAGCGKDGSGTRVVFTTGFGKEDVFRIEDETCTLPELMVYLTTTQNQYENVYGEEIWNASLDGVTLEDNIKETVLAKIARIKTMYLLAQSRKVKLTKEEEKLVSSAAEEYFQSLNETEIQEMGIEKDTVEQLYTEYVMADKVYQQIIEDVNPEISDDEARTITIEHILVKTHFIDSSGSRVEYTQNQRQEAYQKACEIQALAVDGEHDFAQLAAEYSEDSIVTYSFGKGEMELAFETAAFELETNEVSQVVESEAGYHIIKCINTFNREVTDANKQKILEQRRKEVFGQEYDAFVNTLARSLNEEVWDSVTLLRNNQITTSSFFDVYKKYFS